MPAPCQCDSPGWCERHKRYKSAHTFQLCQTRADYRAMWDEQAKASRPASEATEHAATPRRPAAKIAEIELACRACEYFDDGCTVAFRAPCRRWQHTQDAWASPNTSCPRGKW